jgi:F0F1-type ATP synthase membrane subunit b/b'
VQEEQKRTEELNSTIEELFRERREREELAAGMEQQFNESKRQNAEFLNNLDPELKTNYEEAKVEAEELRRQLDDLQSQLDQLNKVKEDLDFQLANSSLKQQASETLPFVVVTLCLLAFQCSSTNKSAN